MVAAQVLSSVAVKLSARAAVVWKTDGGCYSYGCCEGASVPHWQLVGGPRSLSCGPLHGMTAVGDERQRDRDRGREKLHCYES